MSAGTQGTYSITIQVRGALEAGNQFKNLANSLTQVDNAVKQTTNTTNQAGQGFQRLGQQVQSSNTPLHVNIEHLAYALSPATTVIAQYDTHNRNQVLNGWTDMHA